LTVTTFQVGDKVLRKATRQGFCAGTIVKIESGFAIVQWRSGRHTRLRLKSLVPTTEEICREGRARINEYRKTYKRRLRKPEEER
jgi:hypothetical protein